MCRSPASAVPRAPSSIWSMTAAAAGRTASLDIEVMDPAEAAAQMAEAALWERLRASGRLEDVDTFLRLYPTSYLAAAAQRRRDELLGQNTPPAPAAGASRNCRQLRSRPPPAQTAANVALSPPPPPPPVTQPQRAPDKVAALQPIAPAARTAAAAAARPRHDCAADRSAVSRQRRSDLPGLPDLRDDGPHSWRYAHDGSGRQGSELPFRSTRWSCVPSPSANIR